MAAIIVTTTTIRPDLGAGPVRTGKTRPARAADLAPLPVKAKPVADQPFFLVIDNRATYSWMPNGTDPGAYSVRPNGSIEAKYLYAMLPWRPNSIWPKSLLARPTVA